MFLWEKACKETFIKDNFFYKIPTKQEAIRLCFERLDAWSNPQGIYQMTIKDLKESIPNGLDALEKILNGVNMQQNDTFKLLNSYIKLAQKLRDKNKLILGD